MQTENINRPISSKNGEHDCSYDEETESESRVSFSFYWEAGIKCQNLENQLEMFELFIIPEIAVLMSR